MVKIIQCICIVFAIIKVSEGDATGSHIYIAASFIVAAIDFKKT